MPAANSSQVTEAAEDGVEATEVGLRFLLCDLKKLLCDLCAPNLQP